jgi:hypothetical protein
MSGKIRAEELNSKTVETEKIYCPGDGVVMVTYDKRHRPKINMFVGG